MTKQMNNRMTGQPVIMTWTENQGTDVQCTGLGSFLSESGLQELG